MHSLPTKLQIEIIGIFVKFGKSEEDGAKWMKKHDELSWSNKGKPIGNPAGYATNYCKKIQEKGNPAGYAKQDVPQHTSPEAQPIQVSNTDFANRFRAKAVEQEMEPKRTQSIIANMEAVGWIDRYQRKIVNPEAYAEAMSLVQ
jgi:hypothetical protein